VVTASHFDGFFNTRRYNFVRRGQNGLEVTPAYEMHVKSEIARPLNGTLILHKPYTIYGAAWSGESEIAAVEVTVDNGQRWMPADLDATRVPYAWRLWNYSWLDARPGKYSIGARASDSEGRFQPLDRDPAELSAYGNNAIQWVTVSVA
jgi:hypothetical protein